MTTIEAGNRKATINESFDKSFTVAYYVNGQLVLKTHHITYDLAENVAHDFISEGTSSSQFLIE